MFSSEEKQTSDLNFLMKQKFYSSECIYMQLFAMQSLCLMEFIENKKVEIKMYPFLALFTTGKWNNGALAWRFKRQTYCFY